MFVRDMRMFVTTFLQKYIFKSIVFVCYIFFNLKKIRKYLQIRRDAKSNFLNNSTFRGERKQMLKCGGYFLIKKTLLNK
jgi:hypothetical protein